MAEENAAKSAAPSRGSGTIAKGLAMLATVGEFPHGATAAEVAARSGHPFSTAYRLLGSLVDAGFVEYDARTKTYALGLAVFELGQRVGNARGFTGTAAPVLEELTARTGESSVLAVLDGVETLTVHTIDGPQYRQTTDPGDRGPLHSSAIGKVLLAWMLTDERDELLERLPLPARTEHTVTDVSALRAELDASRAAGWVEQGEQHDIGMNAVGVPVLRRDGTVIASLALAAPLFRADLGALREHVPALQDAAARLGTLLP